MSESKKTIILTGGGTAGHVIPHIALLDELEKNYHIEYIGSHNGIEKELIEREGIPYTSISTGKLRRYFDLENIKDFFRVIKGFFDAFRQLGKIKPSLVYSKGGFVSVPVVLAAFFRKVPVIIHESDITPGLATKIALPIADYALATFPETLEYLPEKKAILTGTPIRSSLLEGDREKAKKLCNFNDEKPVLMVIGGSTGAQFLNEQIDQYIDELLKDFQVLHIRGENNPAPYKKEGYKAFSYVHDELKDLFALTDIVLSRAGANAIWEWVALGIPNILVPLPLSASRGDQILNAKSFSKLGYSYYLAQEDIEKDSIKLIETIRKVYKNKEKYIKAMEKQKGLQGNKNVLEVIDSFMDFEYNKSL